ncbi:MAG: TRAP transporter permease [Beijerinckiaceae bacterium]
MSSTPASGPASETNGAAQAAPNQPPAVDVEHGLPRGWGHGTAGRFLFAFALLFSAYQISVSLYAGLPAVVIRALHVGFLLLLSAGLFATLTTRNNAAKYALWLTGILGAGVALYQWVFHDALLLRAGDPLPLDIAVGIVSLAAVFILTWRMMGAALPIIAGTFLAYALFGEYLPAPFNHRGYGLDQVVDQLAYGTEGIYGTPTGVSATYIFLFILFGAFLEKAGMIGLFTDVAMGLFGGARGGPAKVAVFSSALMGTISGSGVANVVATGQFTIPLMKRFGYVPSFAGGVEATASMGGQIMPPVMGAVAFIMAETLDVPYVTIVNAALIPAVLYFGAAFWSVHLEAGRRGLVGLPRDELPDVLDGLKRRWFLLLPLAVLVWLLFGGYTPLFAGSVGLALTAIVILGGTISLGIGSTALRIAFWVALGIACATFRTWGVVALIAVIAVLIAINAFVRGGRETLVICRDSLAEGARQALSVGLACALVGIVIGVLTLTGVATIVGNAVIGIGKDSLFLALVLTMLFSLVLGMGIPTIPNYIITSSLAAPILVKLGVPEIVAHMFVFYFGIMADLTPPVALAAFAASPIAQAPGLTIGLQAMRIAAAGFIVPFMAVYAPALMLQDGGPLSQQFGYPLAVAYIFGKALLGMGLLGIASIGYFRAHLPVWERVLAAAAAALLIVALPLTDEIGFATAAIFFAQHWWRARQATPAGA